MKKKVPDQSGDTTVSETESGSGRPHISEPEHQDALEVQSVVSFGKPTHKPKSYKFVKSSDFKPMFKRSKKEIEKEMESIEKCGIAT